MKRGTLFVFVGISLLAACASNPPPTSANSAAPHRTVPTVPSGAADTGPPKQLKDERFFGYQLVTVNGEKRYCRTQYQTGSRVDKTTTCLTPEQMKRQQDYSTDFLQRAQSAGATGQGCASGSGGGLVGC
jgi:hypothetical protein